MRIECSWDMSTQVCRCSDVFEVSGGSNERRTDEGIGKRGRTVFVLA